MEACEDGGCPRPPKSPSSKAGSAPKGQAGDGPELGELPPAPAAPETLATERNTELELEKVRMEFELTRLKYLHEENERQRQHDEVMAQLQQQVTPRLVGDREGGALARGPQVPPGGLGADPEGRGSPPDLLPTALVQRRAAGCITASLLS